MMASNWNRISIRQAVMLIAVLIVTAAFAACGGSGDNQGAGPVIVTAGPNVDEASGAGVIGGINPDSTPVIQATPTPIPTKPPVAATPTPIPPGRTTDEEGTARLVDELSSDEFPRTSARVIEREFRREFDTAKLKIGKSFVIQGDVIEAGKDASGQPFVHFKAGAGRVTCQFETITNAELLRFSPDGTNAVVGTIDSWNPEDRILTVRDCRVVLGF